MKCKICNCIEEAHIYYWECPLIKDYICIDCCWNMSLKEEFTQFNEKLKELGILDDFKEVCKKCGKNEYT